MLLNAESWALQYFSHTRKWVEGPEETASSARSDAPRSAATQFATSGLTPYSLVLRRYRLGPQCGYFELMALRSDTVAFHVLLH